MPKIKQPFLPLVRLRGMQLLILFLSFTCYAQSSNPAVRPLEDNQVEFDLSQANKAFDQLNLQLSIENLNIEHLQTATLKLNTLINETKTAITLYQKKLLNLDKLNKEAEITQNTDQTSLPTDGKAQNKAGADLIYLKQEQKKITDKMAECRLFIIRAQEAITTYQTAISKLKQQKVLTRGLPLWTLINHLQQSDQQASLTIPKLAEITTLATPLFAPFAVIAALSLLISGYIIRTIKTQSWIRPLFRVKQIGQWDGSLVFFCFLISGISLYWINILANNSDRLTVDLLMLGCVYLWGVAGITVLFKTKLIASACFWYALDCRFFRNLMIFLLSYYTVSQIGLSLAQTLKFSDISWQLAEIVFISLVVILIVIFLIYFGYTHKRSRFILSHQHVITRLLSLLFIGFGILNLLGYHQMAIHLIYACITTLVILFGLFLLVSAIQKIHALCVHPSPVNHKILQLFGYKPNQTIIELMILKITLQVIVCSIGIYLIGETWIYGSSYLNAAYGQVLNGIPFANFTFYPSRIVAGIMIFCVLYLGFRAIATKVSRRVQFEAEEETQVAVASILIYIGFTCALVSALLVSGIDFTGLAIVAGALSVGIGLGLQSIVNNFVSGIILLIEKPIKSGDHIHIDSIEGVVKKIRIRSTHITTAAREDVIIPNSDLITKAVVNYMYTDRYLSISCEVVVVHDSDANLIKQLLLTAIADHEEIIKPPRAKSTVLLQRLDESGMVFQLWFVIKDGNKKSQVRSDVNFAIDRLFRENLIKIAHPQRDLHIKLSDIRATIQDKSLIS